jgi:hypothetical protein
MAEAILYRVFKDIPRRVADGSFEAAQGLLDLLIPGFAALGDPMETWAWLMSFRDCRRRKALVKAYKQRLERGHEDDRIAYISPFAKVENLASFGVLNGEAHYDSARYVARLIQAPHDETHIIAGPYLKPLVHRLKTIWNEENWIFYASVAPKKLDHWLRRNKDARSWYWSDYSAFDATYSSQAWDLVESLYRRIYPSAPLDFWRVLEIWKQPHGKYKSRKEKIWIEYFANVCNASGRDDTALANALINGIVLSISFACALCGVSIVEVEARHIHYASQLVDIAVVGDDSLVACSLDITPYKKDIEKNIRSFGLIVKAESSHNLCDVTFLGMMPYPVRGQFHWGPTIGRRIYKAFWQCEPKGHLPAWTLGVARQLVQYRNVPILHELSAKIVDLLKGHKETAATKSEYSVWTLIDEKMPLWDDTTLDWICRRYPLLTPAMMKEDLRTIGSITRLPAVVHLWTAEVTVAVDDL